MTSDLGARRLAVFVGIMFLMPLMLLRTNYHGSFITHATHEQIRLFDQELQKTHTSRSVQHAALVEKFGKHATSQYINRRLRDIDRARDKAKRDRALQLIREVEGIKQQQTQNNE